MILASVTGGRWWRREFTIRVTPRGCARVALGVLGGVLVLGGILFAFRASLLTLIGRQLVDEDALQPSDAIVVLAGRTPQREMEAADLYTAGLAPMVVLPEGSEDYGPGLLRARGGTFTPEIERRRDVLRQLHVPEAAIVTLTPPVGSTEAEARVVARWMAHRGVRSVIVVTSLFHTGRVRLVYRRVVGSYPVTLRLHGSRLETYRPETWWQSRGTLREGLLEWQKQVFYRLWY